ncbi:uncharacterized protein LOC117117800 [Anneissia japonica]|uniref:uncharacterized protein LOC117117800 n=1 Tax=Anneissia japonica TaxID=1529436 RepID=UPI0014258344|nr:uncharacterized protein LOC117117800 [Anneissia japonica]
MAQLRFRKFIICNFNKNGILNFSEKGKTHCVRVLINNLKSVIDNARLEEVATEDVQDEVSECVTVDADELRGLKEKFVNEAAREKEKVEAAEPAPKRMKVRKISDANHLQGKYIEHYSMNEGDDCAKWYPAYVSLVKGRWVYINYVNGEEFKFSLSEIKNDLLKKELIVPDINVDFFVGKKIIHFWDTHDGERTGLKGRVISLSDKVGFCLVYYFDVNRELADDDDDYDDDDDGGGDDVDESSVYELNVVEEYWLNNVHFF